MEVEKNYVNILLNIRIVNFKGGSGGRSAKNQDNDYPVRTMPEVDGRNYCN